MKRIRLICLCLASLGLAWCFHVPDEDWLPSRNKAKTEDVKNDEVEQAINSFIDWVNMISSEWDEMKNNGETTWEENEIEDAENSELGGETNEEIDENDGIGEDNVNIDESKDNTWNDLVD